MKLTGTAISAGPRKRLIRSFNAGRNVDLFMAAGASTVLIIRLLLRLADYPQVGGATLHIAHLLWGGLLMTLALLLLLSYTGPGIRQWTAVIGGVGFGLFIDEIGKFSHVTTTTFIVRLSR